MGPRRKPLTDEDIEAFRDAVRDVAPLRHDGVTPPPLAPVSRPRRRPPAPPPGDGVGRAHGAGEPAEAHYARPGIRQSELRRLRRGRIPAEARLDLHGLSLAQAAPAVDGFLARASTAGRRCVSIVHGKGRVNGPVLRSAVREWLAQDARVIAFCPAPPADGGTGACYVLLRRPRRDDAR